MLSLILYCENKHKPTHIKYDCNNNPYNLPSITLNILKKSAKIVDKNVTILYYILERREAFD